LRSETDRADTLLGAHMNRFERKTHFAKMFKDRHEQLRVDTPFARHVIAQRLYAFHLLTVATLGVRWCIAIGNDGTAMALYVYRCREAHDRVIVDHKGFNGVTAIAG
jgi:hypothetical protein